jgi:hypothetical protein
MFLLVELCPFGFGLQSHDVTKSAVMALVQPNEPVH